MSTKANANLFHVAVVELYSIQRAVTASARSELPDAISWFFA